MPPALPGRYPAGAGPGPAWAPDATAAHVNSSRKKGFPAACATIAWCWRTGSGAACSRLHQRQAVMGIERRQRYLRGPGVRQPGQPIARSVGGQQQDGPPSQLRCERRQPCVRSGVAPVQVLDHQHQRLALTGMQEELPQ